MKKNTIMMLALAALTAGVSVNADEAQAANCATSCATESACSKLSADEQAFSAKLGDQNRKAFSEKLSAEQRKAVMVAAKNGAAADEAVQRMVAAKEMKEAPAVANAETSAPTVK